MFFDFCLDPQRAGCGNVIGWVYGFAHPLAMASVGNCYLVTELGSAEAELRREESGFAWTLETTAGMEDT